MPTGIVHDLRAVAVTTADDAIAVGDHGSGTRLDMSTPTEGDSPFTVPGLPHLRSVAVHGGGATIAAAGGTVWHTTDLTSAPAFTSSSGDHPDLHALALRPGGGNVYGFGDHGTVHAFTGTNRMPVHNVYPPKLNGVYFSNGNTGHVVGAGLTARYTTNGGQHWQVVPVGGGPYDLNAVHGNGTHAPLAVGATGKVLTLYGAGFAEATTDPGDDLRAVAMGHSGAAVVVGGNGGNGIYHTRLPGSATWVGPTYVGTGLNAVWSFPPYLLDGGDDPTEDFLLGGNEAHVRLLRHAQTPTPTFTPSWGGTAPGITGDITCLWFHDRLAGFAGTLGDSLYRTDVTAMQLAHGSPFPWKGVPGYNTLNGQTSLANIQLRTIGFSNRHQGFIGGRYNGSPVSYARVITDEGGLYSQRFWYDALGRIVLSQNTKQFNAAPQRFSYTLYDDLGRVYEAGELDDGTEEPQKFKDVAGMEVGGLFKPDVLDPVVLKSWVQQRGRREVTRTFYDAPGPGSPFDPHPNYRLRVATTAFYESEYGEEEPDEANFEHATHYRYDIHGNVAELVQDMRAMAIFLDAPDQRYKTLRYTYDLISGNVKQVSYQQGDVEQMYHRYTYDADNRITKVETSQDGVTWDLDADYFYYPHGPLQRVELGQQKVQGVDYAYTLQGWLKGINSDRLVPESDMGLDGMDDVANANRLIGRDAFGMSLNYFGEGDYQAIDATRWDNTTGTRAFAPLGGDMAGTWNPLYNGNIAHTVNSLQPFGGWSGTGQSAQVLAQVYKYDQLNRLKTARGYTGLDADNDWALAGATVTDMYKSTYAYDANGNIDTLARYDGSGDLYDGMKFGYHVDANDRKVRNRPYHIRELAGQSGTVATDIPHRPYQPDDIVDRYNAGGTVNTANNYGYDELGQRIRDDQGEMEAIHWTASGKVKAIVRPGASSKLDIHFGYDAGGNRIMKRVGDPDIDAGGYSEHYVRDAQGNIMAIYRYTNTGTASFRVIERPIYGSSRLGSYDRPRQLLGSQNIPAVATMSHAAKRYELTDHLGNVATVVTGRLLPGNGAGSLYQAEVISATLHEPFGLNLTGMNWQSDQARFGFQGQIKELEMNAIHFKYREYSLDGGGFWSVDPLAAKYPWNSPYAFSENRVIDSNELEGLETIPGGQVVTSDDLLARPVLTTATESTITPMTQWDSNLRLPASGPATPPELSTLVIGGAGLAEDIARNTISGGLLLVSTVAGGIETLGREGLNAIVNDFSSKRHYSSPSVIAPYSLDNDWNPVRRESLMHGTLTPTEGAEVIGATLSVTGYGVKGFINTGSNIINKASEIGVKGVVNTAITNSLRSLDKPSSPPSSANEENE